MRRGFTLVEMMMVMVVMALIATLATGAAMKSIRQAKEQRINTTRGTLEMALMNYRAYEGNWPTLDGTSDTTNVVFNTPEKIAKVFEPLINSTTRVYLDPAALLTKVDGKVLSLREAMADKKGASFPLGYPNPDKGSEFKYYKVTINLVYDTVKVER